MEQIKINAELVLVLESKQAWVNRVPECLPKPTMAAQQLIFIDANGNHAAIGEDFRIAEETQSYPISVYRLQRIKAAIEQPDPEMYYIRTRGYIGNGLIWWRPNSAGYTSDLRQAGKYTHDKAMSICRSSHGDNLAYKCSTVMNLKEGLILQLHADYAPKPDIGTAFGE